MTPGALFLTGARVLRNRSDMSLIFAAIVLLLVCSTTGYKPTSRTISARISLLLEYFMSVNCYMVHLLKGFIGSNGYDQSWKGFPRKSPISANIMYSCPLSDCWLASPQPFPYPSCQIFCPVNHHDLTRVLIEFSYTPNNSGIILDKRAKSKHVKIS